MVRGDFLKAMAEVDELTNTIILAIQKCLPIDRSKYDEVMNKAVAQLDF